MPETQSDWLSGQVVGISASVSEDLPAYGFGKEHLREFVVRLGRHVLRAGGNLAYGGHLKEDSFTLDLITLIIEEQKEDAGDKGPWIGQIYNHSPWPYYIDLTEQDEASFVEACRFVRVTQEDAGIPEDDRLVQAHTGGDDLHTLFNRSAVLTAMRRAMARGMQLHEPTGYTEAIPPVSCRVLLGGRMRDFTGVLPGLFEELLYSFEQKTPIFVVGGFGGASGRIAGYLSGGLSKEEAGFDLEKLRLAAPDLAKIEAGFETYRLPSDMITPNEALTRLVKYLDEARRDLSAGLHNHLSGEDNQRLFTTLDTAEAAGLVLKGLRQRVSDEAAT